MERAQKLVITLLIVTIILSVASIAINFVLLNSDSRARDSGISPAESGNINLVIERSASSAESSGGLNG